ncbi:MAG: hypothetical protein ACK5XX_02340, partial [Holosporales bacterium]
MYDQTYQYQVSGTVTEPGCGTSRFTAKSCSLSCPEAPKPVGCDTYRINFSIGSWGLGFLAGESPQCLKDAWYSFVSPQDEKIDLNKLNSLMGDEGGVNGSDDMFLRAFARPLGIAIESTEDLIQEAGSRRTFFIDNLCAFRNSGGKICEGTMLVMLSPISLIWDEGFNIDDSFTLSTFPLNPDVAAGQTYEWRASSKAPLLV